MHHPEPVPIHRTCQRWSSDKTTIDVSRRVGRDLWAARRPSMVFPPTRARNHSSRPPFITAHTAGRRRPERESRRRSTLQRPLDRKQCSDTAWRINGFFNRCSHFCFNLAVWGTRGCCINSRIGPTWDNLKLRHFDWMLNQLTEKMTNENYVI